MIGILTDQAVGGTFLTWSVHYLRGDDSYFLVEANKQVNLTSNPLTNVNAHDFIPNQPNRGISREFKVNPGFNQELEKLYNMYNQLSRLPSNEIIYLHTCPTEQDTKIAVDYLTNGADKIVLVTSKGYPLYHCKYNQRSGGNWISPTQFSADPDVLYNNTAQAYFSESYTLFQEQKLTSIWDQREFIALNFDPYANLYIEDYFNYSVSHYAIDIAELYNFKDYVEYVFDYLNLEINNTRYAQWEEVYNTWRLLHKERMLFVIYFNRIIDYIIHGYDLDLTRFNLDLMQEATIQHTLIYKHNLNLKTWQLEKFTNTKQLHQLLEPNIHDLSKSKIKNIELQ